jgi:ABC-type multidrug transport system permease subunit
MKSLGIYAFGVVLALGSGWVQIRIHDLLLTALVVLASAMLLGSLSPQKPWRWAVLFLIVVPLMQLLAPLFAVEKPVRAETLESFLVFLPAIVGAYGGSVLRRAVHALHN